ncbi:CDP-glycerol glycerophosphotransferase family protein [Jeotgalibacillus proteolyticus]|uniref:CDP-glycerol glycerophosphotransferase family protein n=1 Tax=Jeotgalibacillus proteolyticus TaxID=2082395 RepID=UPI003CF58CFA
MLAASISSRAKNSISRIYRKAFLILGKLPRKKNVIVFESFHGKQFSCNPRAVYEYLNEHHPEYNMYWSVNKSDRHKFEGLGLKLLTRFRLKWLFYMATAQFWVINTRLPLWMKKPKKTVYLQTWHGTPLKKLGLDISDVKMPGTTTEKYRRNFITESSNWDYLIAPNKYSAEIFKKAFKYEKNMLLTGYPRNDILYKSDDENVKSEFITKTNLPKDKRIILYAPTWRDDEFIEVGKYKFSLQMDLKKMQEQLGSEYIVLLRMHYLIAEKLELDEFRGFAFNFSNWEDIRELYLVSDLLITDYSSVFFDYANLNRPVIFYVYDLEKYKEELRGFYFDFETSAPGPLVTTTDEIIKTIKGLEKQHDNQCISSSFREKYCAWEDGHASQRVVNEVFLSRNPSKRQ